MSKAENLYEAGITAAIASSGSTAYDLTVDTAIGFAPMAEIQKEVTSGSVKLLMGAAVAVWAPRVGMGMMVTGFSKLVTAVKKKTRYDARMQAAIAGAQTNANSPAIQQQVQQQVQQSQSQTQNRASQGLPSGNVRTVNFARTPQQVKL